MNAPAIMTATVPASASDAIPDAHEIALRPIGVIRGDDPAELRQRIRRARDLAMSRVSRNGGIRRGINMAMAEAANELAHDVTAPVSLLRDMLALCIVLNRADMLADELGNAILERRPDGD